MTSYSEELRIMRVQGAPIDSQSAEERDQLIVRINQVAREERKRASERTFVRRWATAAIILMMGSFSLSYVLARQESAASASASAGAGTPRQNRDSGQSGKEKGTGGTPTAHASRLQREKGSSRPPENEERDLALDAAGSHFQRLRSGARLVAAGNAQYSISMRSEAERGETVNLVSGRVELSVPALGAEELAVVTHDTKVVVHGTKFSVALVAGESGRLRTLVEVTEGLVAVHSRGEVEYLRPGASWSSKGAVSEPEDSGSVQRSKPSAGVARVSTVPAGTLSIENGLYAEAMDRKLAGDYAAAMRALETLLSNYPGSPLAPSASKAREKIQHLMATETRK